MKNLCDRKAHELKNKLDNLQTMKAENDALQQLKHRETPESRRITVIEQEIEKIQRDIESKVTWITAHTPRHRDVSFTNFAYCDIGCL